MTLIQNSLLPLLPLFLSLGGSASGGPILQPNEHYAKVGREQAEKDIRSCASAAEFTASPTRPEMGRSAGGRSTDLWASSGRSDPVQQSAVERCLGNKGYKVIGWQ